MSDSQLSFSSITGTFLKRNYGKGSAQIENMQNLKAVFIKKLSTSDEIPSGDGYYIPVNVSGNESGRASNESEAFANAQSVTDVQFVIKPKHTFWPFQLTGFSMEVARSNADSFARTLKRQMDDNSARFWSDLNRQAWGTATGAFATVSSGTTSATQTFASVQYFRQDMRVDFYDSTLATRNAVTNLRVTSISVSAKTVTFDQSITTTTGDVVCKAGVLFQAPTDYKELFGAQAIVDTTTYNTNIQGVSKSTYPVLQATVIDAASATITNSLLQQLETTIENASESPVTEKWSGRAQRDRYLELLVPMKRFMSQDTLDSGFDKPVEHNGKPWYVDKDCPDGMVFAFGKDTIQKFSLMEPDIVDKDGSTIRALPGSDVYQGYYKSHMNIGTLRPNGNGKIITLV